MSQSRQRARLALAGLLALALAMLALVIRGQGSGAELPQQGTPRASPTLRDTPPAVARTLEPLPTVDPTLAAIVRPSLPEQWAAAILDSVIAHQDGTSQTVRADLSWLAAKGLWGPLSRAGGGVAVGEAVVAGNDRTLIEVSVPDGPGEGGLVRVGRIERRDTTLVLTEVGASNSPVRILSQGVLPGDVLLALAREAEQREVRLQVAYWATPGGGAALVLAGVLPLAEAGVLPTPTPSPPDLTAEAASPTPTLVYEPELGQMVASGLAPYFEAARSAPEVQQVAAARFAGNHTWSGLLTREGGALTVAGRPVGLGPEEAVTLAVFGLTADGEEGPRAVLVMEARWDGNGTDIRAGDLHQYYYGFRLAEVAGWMALLAEEEGGQLEVAFDDLGGYRAVTVLNLHPLTPPPDS